MAASRGECAADYLSKVRDVDDFGLSAEAFSFVSQRFGPFTVDRFASEHNANFESFRALTHSIGALEQPLLTALLRTGGVTRGSTVFPRLPLWHQRFDTRARAARA
jgi:hypothetical protein